MLALAPKQPFAKVLINTGRLSVAANLRGSALLTPDTDAWNTPVRDKPAACPSSSFHARISDGPSGGAAVELGSCPVSS